MSVPEPAAKRARVERDKGLVIVSNFGDTRPEEIVPDSVATYFLNGGMSVRSYVVVVDFGTWPIFLANWRREADAKKGIVAKRYVKKMIPRTVYLRDITCDVMILFCHGISNFVDAGVQRPHSICFVEGDGVSKEGVRHQAAPHNSQVWSCSSYTDDNGTTYRKREHSITLTEVVRGSRLVLLLCCCGVGVMREYRQERGGEARPDFVYFAMDDIHDISINIFLALLIDALEGATVRVGAWDEFIRRCVCQVLEWVKWCDGDAEIMWGGLIEQRCVEMGRTTFRIKGSINNFNVETDDKQTVLRELQSLTLLLWDGGEGGARAERGERIERVVNHETAKEELVAWMEGKPFRRASLGERAESPIRIDALLLQLKGLLMT